MLATTAPPTTTVSTGSDLRVRSAVVTDVNRLTEMIHALAAFHGEADHCRMDAVTLRGQLFGPDPVLRAHVAEIHGRVVGMVLWYRTYSTWDAATGIHVEDLYVDPVSRGLGTGLALITAMAEVAVDHGYTRIEGQVLNRNTLRNALVEHGGSQMDVWETYRIDGADLVALSGRDVVDARVAAVG